MARPGHGGPFPRSAQQPGVSWHNSLGGEIRMNAEEQYHANMTWLASHPNASVQAMPAQLAQVPLTNVQLVSNTQGQMLGAVWDVVHQQWVSLCDQGDPLGQAERDVESIYSPQIKVFTLLGLGLGYAAVALAKRLLPYQRLSIWEVSPAICKAMFYAVDTTPLFHDKRVHLFVIPEIASQLDDYWLSLESMEKFHIGAPLRAGYTTQADSALYDAVLEKTADLLRHHMVGLSTWKMFGHVIGENDLQNMPEYFTTPGFEHLQGYWKDRPAVCVAAGPSLQKNLCQLLDPQIRHAVALITAGTTYALLQGLHLQPDIVTTIDFQRLNWTDQFQYIPLDADCPLVYLHSTYPQTVRRWPGPKFVAENSSDTVGWFRQFGEGKAQAAQVQTVAHLNLLVALMLGANPICLLGQDLAMLPAQHHATGARAQDQAPSEVPAEAFVMMPDYAGQPTHTRHSFLSMKSVFERIAAQYPDRTIMNCTEGGLPLAGIRNVPLRDVLAPYRGSLSQPGFLRREIRRLWQGYTPQVSDELGPAVTALQRDVETLLTDWCPQVLRWQAQRARWDGCEPQADLVHDGLGNEAVVQLLALEPALQTLQAAFGLFVIREFRLVELLAAIPEDPRWVTESAVAQRATCDRIATVALLVQENGDAVQRTLREVRTRLQDILAPSAGQRDAGRTVQQLIARQHYGHASAVLATPLDITPVQQARLWGQVLYHTQQYAAAQAVFSAWNLAPQHVTRIEQHLAQVADDVRTALPAYFEGLSKTAVRSEPLYY